MYASEISAVPQSKTVWSSFFSVWCTSIHMCSDEEGECVRQADVNHTQEAEAAFSNASASFLIPALYEEQVTCTSLAEVLLPVVTKMMIEGLDLKTYGQALHTLQHLLHLTSKKQLIDIMGEDRLTRVLNSSGAVKSLQLAIGAKVVYDALAGNIHCVYYEFLPDIVYLQSPGVRLWKLAVSFLQQLREQLFSYTGPGNPANIFGFSAELHTNSTFLPTFEHWEQCKQCIYEGCFINSCRCSKQLPAEALIRLASRFDVKMPSFAGVGRLGHVTPAMDAALHGHAAASEALMNEDFREDEDHNMFPYSAARHPVLLIASIMLVIWIVGILVPMCSGKGTGLDSQVCIIIAKGITLLILNCMMKYAWSFLRMVQATGGLIAAEAMIKTPWAQTTEDAGMVLGVLLACTFAFMCLDLRKILSPGQEGEQKARAKLVLRDIYQDVNTPFLRCMQRFALTLIFLLCYETVCGKAQDPTLRSLTFWYLSVLVQIYFAESCSKRESDNDFGFCDLLRWACCADLPYEPDLWKVLFQSQTVTVVNEDAEDDKDKEGVPVSCGTLELTCRFILSYISNGFIRVIVLYTLPIFLATTTDEKDFALNAFAVTFIVELDNLTSKKRVEAYEEEDPQRQPALLTAKYSLIRAQDKGV
eukprot:TRINITY_DN2821_c0_g1_i6.p1 TRINITY_DN2821_c0_g1~~TRINITY_DN2821_c0_g1_i6.p1  ORF type:complete len:645 (-),score=101.69 TRINITY_DN2821_c0_g1_i6:26-1960(-)